MFILRASTLDSTPAAAQPGCRAEALADADELQRIWVVEDMLSAHFPDELMSDLMDALKYAEHEHDDEGRAMSTLRAVWSSVTQWAASYMPSWGRRSQPRASAADLV